jgi:uncharacterized protein (TIGR00730 family)
MYRHAAQELGTAIAETGRRLVYGGGNVGLMGFAADAAIAAGGDVIGVIPQNLVDRELAHRGIAELHIVDSMHQRKQLMSDLSDGFVIMPGGLGTLEEFFEVWTWAQLGLHRKPYGILNVGGYYDSLLEFLDHAVERRFVQVAHRKLLIVEDDPSQLLKRLDKQELPVLQKVVDRHTT